MEECWSGDPENRPEFSQIRQKLAGQLEDVTEEYSYLKLDAQKDYYNVQYGDQKVERENSVENTFFSRMLSWFPKMGR